MGTAAAGSNYVESMYARWSHDPASVDASWNTYFQEVRTPLPFRLASASALYVVYVGDTCVRFA